MLRAHLRPFWELLPIPSHDRCFLDVWKWMFFAQNLKKRRFTPSNHLLEQDLARLRVSNPHWDPETGRKARFIKVWRRKWWFLAYFTLKSEENATKSLKIKRNREKTTEPDQNRQEPTQIHLEKLKKDPNTQKVRSTKTRNIKTKN